jgi:hypothetical protein
MLVCVAVAGGNFLWRYDDFSFLVVKAMLGFFRWERKKKTTKFKSVLDRYSLKSMST